jgi:hypothetical protein
MKQKCHLQNIEIYLLEVKGKIKIIKEFYNITYIFR